MEDWSHFEDLLAPEKGFVLRITYCVGKDVLTHYAARNT